MKFLKGDTAPLPKRMGNTSTQSDPSLFMEDHSTQTAFKQKLKKTFKSDATQSEISQTKSSVQTDFPPDYKDEEIQVKLKPKIRPKSMAEHEAQIGIPYSERRHSSSQYETFLSSHGTQTRALTKHIASQSTPDIQENFAQTVGFVEIQPEWLKVAEKKSLIEMGVGTEVITTRDIGIQKMVKKTASEPEVWKKPEKSFQPQMKSTLIQTEEEIHSKIVSITAAVQTERKEFAETGIQTRSISTKMAKTLIEAGFQSQLAQFSIEEPQQSSSSKIFKRSMRPSTSSTSLAAHEQESFLTVSEYHSRRYSASYYEDFEKEEKISLLPSYGSSSSLTSSFMEAKPSWLKVFRMGIIRSRLRSTNLHLTLVSQFNLGHEDERWRIFMKPYTKHQRTPTFTCIAPFLHLHSSFLI